MLARTLLRLVVACFFSCTVTLLLAQELRTWKDSQGKFELQATLVKFVDGQVYLRGTDGSEFVIPSSKLSAADQKFLKEQSGSKPAPTAKAAAEIDSPSVVVSVSDGQKTLLYPAFVYGQRDGKRFVVANTVQHVDQDPKSVFQTGKPLKCVAMWDADGKRQQQDLKEVALFAPTSKWIFQGPAIKLPTSLAELPLVPGVRLAEVELLGYDVDQKSNSFALSRTRSKIEELAKIDDGSNHTYFRLSHKFPGTLMQGVVVDVHGQLLGVADSKLVYGNPHHKAPTVGPLRTDFFWEEPYLLKAYVFPISGDAEKIVWQVGVDFLDPQQKLKTGQLLVLRLNLPGIQHRVNQEGNPLPLRADDAGVIKVELKKGELSQDAQLYVQKVFNVSTSSWLVGQWEEKIHGTSQVHEFRVQAGFTTAANTNPTWSKYQKAEFHFHQYEDKVGDLAKLPNIHAFGGPRTPKPKVGTLTSTNSASKLQLESELPRDVPKPEAFKLYVAGKLVQNGPFAIRQINISVADPQVHRSIRPRMAISPDEQWLYLVDEEAVLHQLDARNLKVVTTLKLPAMPAEIKFAKSGMLLVFRKTNQLWKLDPTTLEVRLVYTIPAIAGLGAAPDSDLCFAMVPAKGQGDGNLWMLDLAANRLLHSIKYTQGRDRDTSRLEDTATIEQLMLTLCAGGKYLFVKGGQMHRYRIDENELLFEELGAYPNSLNSDESFRISGDGKVIANARSESRGGVMLRFYNGMRLEEEIGKASPTDPTIALGMDPVTGNIFCSSRTHLRVLDKKGEQIAEAKLDDFDSVTELQVFPKGDRCLMLSASGFKIYDLKPDRVHIE